ncbi:glycine oxidase ThiO [Thiomicrorhabdus sp. zzn3]|uniref:glycine oxidase ThiO n=1 Tax=Thiomicrorhabdus sp. zzn3 TaxID=3039775 RepID=UPI00243711B9|nr:glycine oxidase ThiO [Thiomicrorhabdus sp. zzn3]MDG6779078.1 glycine oxidase ThiO [Thiomicrorhabdus sp. zzn3]
MSHLRIGILGAGLIGRLMALQLSSDYEVTLFDSDEQAATQSPAYLAAAMLAPVAESVETSPTLMQMGQRSLQLWPELLAQLDEPVFFQQAGSLILAFEQDSAHLVDFARHLKGDEGEDFVRINAARLAELEPELAAQSKPFKHRLFLPHEGQLDNRQLLAALASTLNARGVIWHAHTPAEIREDRVWSNAKPYDFDRIIDCRGLGAKAQIPAGQRLRGVRGEVLRLYAPDVTLNRPVRLMHPRYPLYIAPKENHHFVVGATQIESEDTRQPTVRSALELLSACFSVHKGFAEAEIIQFASGLRPALADNEPRIWVKDHLIQINGLFRHGYLLAPVIVEQCVALVNGKAEDLPNYPNLIEKL